MSCNYRAYTKTPSNILNLYEYREFIKIDEYAYTENENENENAVLRMLGLELDLDLDLDYLNANLHPFLVSGRYLPFYRILITEAESRFESKTEAMTETETKTDAKYLKTGSSLIHKEDRHNVFHPRVAFHFIALRTTAVSEKPSSA
jgi:hypothetical protein